MIYLRNEISEIDCNSTDSPMPNTQRIRDRSIESVCSIFSHFAGSAKAHCLHSARANFTHAHNARSQGQEALINLQTRKELLERTFLLISSHPCTILIQWTANLHMIVGFFECGGSLADVNVAWLRCRSRCLLCRFLGSFTLASEHVQCAPEIGNRVSRCAFN